MFKKIALFLLLMLFTAPVFAENNTKSNVQAFIRTNDNKAIWDSYLKSAESKVNSAWHPIKGEKRTASVLLKANSDGSICKAVSVIRSSGSKEFDTMALNTVKSISSLGSFPSATKRTSVIIYFRLTNQYEAEVKPAEQKTSEEKPSENNEEAKKEDNANATAENKDEAANNADNANNANNTSKNKTEQQKQETKPKTFVPTLSN